MKIYCSECIQIKKCSGKVQPAEYKKIICERPKNHSGSHKSKTGYEWWKSIPKRTCTAKEFMDYWMKEGIAISDVPVSYLYGEKLIVYTAEQIDIEKVNKIQQQLREG